LTFTAVEDEEPEGWEEFFQYRELEMKVSSLEEKIKDLEFSMAEILRTIESSQFIGVSDSFATYVPRNRRNP